MTIRRLKCDLSPEITTNLTVDETMRFDCCRVADRIPYDAECFVRDISKDLNKLYERHKKMFVKRRRIMEMALPVRRWCRFVPKCPCPFTKTIQVMPADTATYTRTEQLALPTVRRLLNRRQYALDMGDKIAESILNRLLRSSYLSLYSRLTNTQPLKKPTKKKPQTKKQKSRHAKYVAEMSKPKVLPEPEKPERKVGDISPRRLKKLSKPKKVPEDETKPWELTDNARHYKASERIKKIAQPRMVENVHIKEEPDKISKNALNYKPSARIKEMAQPLTVHDNKVSADVKEEPFAISPNALKYKPTARIKELAEPKEFENTHIRENPFAISPAALKAKASPRLIELAKPKGA